MSESIKTAVLGKDFPEENQKNMIKVFSLIFDHKEMTGWQDYLGSEPSKYNQESKGLYKTEWANLWIKYTVATRQNTALSVTAFKMEG